MTCPTETSLQAYTGPDAPDVTVGCLPSGSGKPTQAPASDQLPFYYDTKGECLYYFDCTTSLWIKQHQTVGDLPPLDTDMIANICSALNIPVSYETNDCIVEGSVTLQTLADHIAECLGLGSSIVSISAGPDGRLVFVRRDGTTTPVQIDTDQVTVTTTPQAIIFTNENGLTFTVTAQNIKDLIADDYVSNEELATILGLINYDQVTNFLVRGNNLVIVNEDESEVTLPISDLIASLNNGLATDQELANAIANIDTVRVIGGRNTTVTSTTTSGDTIYTVNSQVPLRDASGNNLNGSPIATDLNAVNYCEDPFVVFTYGENTANIPDTDIDDWETQASNSAVGISINTRSESVQIVFETDNGIAYRTSNNGCDQGGFDNSNTTGDENVWRRLVTNDPQNPTITASILRTLIEAGDGLNVGTLGQISICISDGEGNKLEMRDGCLYVGDEAPADVSNLYVANNGDDSAEGTKDAPLKTIKEAKNRIIEAGAIDKSSTIHLKAGDTFDVENIQARGTAVRTLSVWGDPLSPDGATHQQILSDGYDTSRWYTWNELNRPILNVLWKEQQYNGQTVQATRPFVGANDTTFVIEGIEIKQTAPTGSVPTHPLAGAKALNAEGEVSYNGVIFDDVGGQNDNLIGAYGAATSPTVTFLQSQYKDSDANPRQGDTLPALYIANTTLKLKAEQNNSSPSWYSNYNITKLPNNIRTVVATDNFIAPIQRSNGVAINVQSDVLI